MTKFRKEKLLTYSKIGLEATGVCLAIASLCTPMIGLVIAMPICAAAAFILETRNGLRDDSNASHNIHSILHIDVCDIDKAQEYSWISNNNECMVLTDEILYSECIGDSAILY